MLSLVGRNLDRRRATIGRCRRGRFADWPIGRSVAAGALQIMVLSDRTIRDEIAAGRIVVEPIDLDDVQPASIDLHLDCRFLVFANTRQQAFIDVRQPLDELTEAVQIDAGKPFMLHPGEFALGSTQERIELPDDLVARLEGKSSLGRMGLLIHSTAGFVDPGWQGRLTLELSNVARLPIALYPGMKIGQISFLRLSKPAERLYGSPELGSKYQGQSGPTASRFHRDFGNAPDAGGT